MRGEAFPRRLCRACCSRMCTSLMHDVFQLPAKADGVLSPAAALGARGSQRASCGQRGPLAARYGRLRRCASHARRSLRSASLLRQRQPSLHRARAALRPMYATGGFCFPIFLSKSHVSIVFFRGSGLIHCWGGYAGGFAGPEFVEGLASRGFAARRGVASPGFADVCSTNISHICGPVLLN